MKLSTNWLSEHLEFDCPLGELAGKLTMAGLEVEEIAELSPESFRKHGGSGESADTVFDVKITPNRGDWLSVIGVAREAAPLVGSKVRVPEPHVEGGGPAAAESVRIDIDAPELCGRYVGMLVRNVTIKESPGWMKDRLIAAGMRPINNVVDVTNYVMLELGQPLHAFDYNLLHGRRIVVRTARPGETITSIDGIERKLEPDMLVIADEDRAVAIAGVMGGAHSEVGEQTQDVLIESANFDTVSVRRTSKRLAMVTESSYRFERGVDPSTAPLAALRAAELMRDLAGGEVAAGMVDAHPRPVEPLIVEARPERVNAVLGTEIEVDEMVGYLSGLGIETSVEDGMLICRIPTFRRDITREIDIVEEVGRAMGYDHLPMTLPVVPLPGKDSPEGGFSKKLRRILMSCGAQEVLTHSLVDGRLAELAGRADRTLKVRNPLSEDLDAMRVMLVPNLLEVIQRNQSFGTADVSVFEIGKVYYREDGAMGERLSVAGAMTGSAWQRAWSLPADALDVDFFWCKGEVESLLDGLGIEGAKFEATVDPLLHPTRAAKVTYQDRDFGLLGEISPAVQEALGLRERAYAFELDFRALMESAPRVPRYEQLARYPALYRHLAIVASDDVDYARLAGTVREAGRGIVEDVDLLDVYKGEQIRSDQRSLTLSIVFRSHEKTLTDEEVNGVLAAIKEALGREQSVSFR